MITPKKKRTKTCYKRLIRPNSHRLNKHLNKSHILSGGEKQNSVIL